MGGNDPVMVGVEKHLLGRRLFKLREGLKLSLSEVGQLWYNKNKVQAWENGQWKLARESDLIQLLGVYGVTSPEEVASYVELLKAAKRPEWYRKFSRSLDGAFPALEESATRISSYQNVVIPGQLQTPGYHIHLPHMVLQRHGKRTTREDFNEFRAERQKRLFAREVDLMFILEESVIRRGRTLGPEVWDEQATKIRDLSAEHPNLSVHVLPADQVLSHTGSFLVWDFSNPLAYSIAYSEAGLEADYVDDPGQVAYVKRAFQRLLGASLPLEESMNIIMKGVDA